MIASSSAVAGRPATAANLMAAARALLERFPLSIIQLAMRIGVGGIFFNAGLIKKNFNYALAA